MLCPRRWDWRGGSCGVVPVIIVASQYNRYSRSWQSALKIVRKVIIRYPQAEIDKCLNVY